MAPSHPSAATPESTSISGLPLYSPVGRSRRRCIAESLRSAGTLPKGLTSSRSEPPSQEHPHPWWRDRPSHRSGSTQLQLRWRLSPTALARPPRSEPDQALDRMTPLLHHGQREFSRSQRRRFPAVSSLGPVISDPKMLIFRTGPVAAWDGKSYSDEPFTTCGFPVLSGVLRESSRMSTSNPSLTKI